MGDYRLEKLYLTFNQYFPLWDKMWYAKTKFYLHTRKLTLEDYADLIKLVLEILYNMIYKRYNKNQHKA